MYNILVVDDEARERNIVRILLQQKYENQFNINEASSGEEAIKILNEGQADILIMDIQMPGMNGLEAVKKIRQTNKQIYIIILTAYNYFEYAKDAIEAGVNDFLLKPLIREELKRATDKFFQHYIEITQYNTSDTDYRSTMEFLSKELVSLLAFSSKDAHEVERYINLLNIKNKQGYCVIFEPVFKTTHAETINTYYHSVLAFLQQAFERDYRRYIVNCIGGKIVIFVFVDEIYQHDIEEKLIKTIHKKASEYTHTEMLMSKGRAYSVGIDLNQSFTEALAQLNHSIVELNTKDYEKLVSKNIREQNIQKATAIINDLMMEMNKDNELDKIKFKMIGILTEVTKKTLDHAMQVKYLDDLSFIIKIDKLENLLKFIQGYIKKIGKELENSYNDKSHYVIDQIIKYINNNYDQPLSVEELASEFNLSSFYLSKLFKDYQKVCFTDYVTNTRIEKAIELMEDVSKNIKNIANEVGYWDANYFSRVFKKKMGIGPKEYRKNFL